MGYNQLVKNICLSFCLFTFLTKTTKPMLMKHIGTFLRLYWDVICILFHLDFYNSPQIRGLRTNCLHISHGHIHASDKCPTDVSLDVDNFFYLGNEIV